MLDRWYHGRISRQIACERLEAVGEPGGYLVRESVGQPGDYAISYLSRLGQIHHFKINSNCGDYYIGGRQFYSLNDLIGFYANCSCILENESLEVPVVPPTVSSSTPSLPPFLSERKSRRLIDCYFLLATQFRAPSNTDQESYTSF